MEKRGVLRKNFIEIILLLLVVGLIILATINYFTREEGRVAKGYFRLLTNEIQKLKDGEQPNYFVLHVPSGWTIKGYDKGAGDGPASCEGSSCLCLCKNGWFGSTDCEEDGFCKIVYKDVRLLQGTEKKGVKFEEGNYDIYLSQDPNYIYISSTDLRKKYETPMSTEIVESSLSEEENKQIVLTAMQYAKENSLAGRKCLCGDKCEEYATHLVKYSREYGIPDPVLSLSLMMQESSCQNHPCNSAGHCGLIQIPSSIENWQDPETNIKTGLSILRNKYEASKDGRVFQGCSKRNIKYTGWEAALRGYNGWGCKKNYPAQDWFVDQIIERYSLLKNIQEKGENEPA